MTIVKVPVIDVDFDAMTIKFMSDDAVYPNSRCKFALCSLPTKTKKSQQLTQFHHCRDGFLQKVLNHFNGGTSLGDVSTAKTVIMFRVIAAKKPTESVPDWFKDNFDKWAQSSAKAGLRLVNHFEKENSWRLSKLYKVKTPKNSPHHIHMVQGSRWWMLSTHTLSLFILLIRLGAREDVHKLGNLRKMESIVNKISTFSNGADSGLCEDVWKWPILLKNRKSLFNCKDFSENYSRTNSGYDGIYGLTTGTIKDTELNKKFKAACKAGK